MKIKVKLDFITYIGLALFGIVVSNSQAIISLGISDVVMYLSYAILLTMFSYNFFIHHSVRWQVGKLLLFFLLITMFCLGIFLQYLSLNTKLYLSFSMIIIAFILVVSSGLRFSISDYRRLGYWIFYSLIVVLLLAILFKTPLFTLAVEGGSFNYGFNGGMDHKNYYGITLFSSFILIYLNYHYGKKQKKDLLIMMLELFLIAFSNSRTVYLLLLAFFGVVFFDNLKYVKKGQRVFSMLLLVGIGSILGMIVYIFFVSKSGSYGIRVQGLMNYLQYYRYDPFHLWMGSADMAFSTNSVSYENRVRSIIGWNGTVELSILSILIKNGLLGLIGYALMMLRYFLGIIKTKSFKVGVIGLSLWLPLLFSAGVENYVVNLHIVYMVVVFMLLSSLSNLELTEEDLHHAL